ncbi:MAG: trypsin-like peptidase domain-containing protein [Anaerolineae bacterium]
MSTSRNTLVVIASLGVLIVALVAGITGGIVGFGLAMAFAPKPTAAQITARPATVQPQLPAAAPALPAAPAAPAAPAPSASGSGSNDIIAAVAKVKPAVVRIATQIGEGSGVIVDQQGHIVTNNHVVQGAQQFQVRFDNGGTASAHLVGTYPTSDLAVIQVDSPIPAYAVLGDSNKLVAGERVIAIGSALGQYTNSVTTGVVSGTNRQLGGMGNLIQTDAPINEGNSGGPLVSLNGEVIGINSMVERGQGRTGPAEGLGFAIPSAIVRTVANQLIAGKQVEFPYMGVSLKEAANGWQVATVEQNSGAAKAGLQQGDIITAVDGVAVNPEISVQALLATHSVGDSVTVNITRSGQSLSLTVTLSRRPATSG